MGDHIKIFDGHKKAGKTFIVERLLARGAVETVDEIVFEREEWLLVEVVITAANEHQKLISNFDTTVVIKPEIKMSEELLEEAELLPVMTIQDMGELTEDEEKERHRLELKVDRAFCEAGWALAELRDKRLYRSTHQTFENYCRERFNYTRDAAYFKIAAAAVYSNIQKNLPTIGRQIPLSTNERQLRDLAKADFTPLAQVSVWQQAVEQADGKVPSGRIVKDIVERLKEKPLIKASDFCTVGDPFILTRLEGAERKYNGCWAIASEHRDFTIAVDVHDTTLAVKPENLDAIDLPDVRRQLPQTLKRIRRLRDCGLLDRCAYTVLESLGRQIYLTPLEEKFLQVMETEYKVVKD